MTKTGYVEYEIYYRLISVKHRLAGSVKHRLISVNFFMRDNIYTQRNANFKCVTSYIYIQNLLKPQIFLLFSEALSMCNQITF